MSSPLRLLCLVGYHLPAKRFVREFNDEGQTVTLICPRCGTRKDPGSGVSLNTSGGHLW